MLRRGRLTRTAASFASILLCVLGVLGCLAGEARADWTNVRGRDLTNPRHREPFCLFFSGPSCTNSLSLDGIGAYQRAWNDKPVDKDYGRLAAEIGYMLHLGRSTMHAGVAFEGGGAFNDVDVGWHLIPKLRLRYWPGYSLVALEFSPGFVYESHARKVTGPTVSRMGAHGEVGVSFWGVFTLYAGGEWLTERDATPAANFIAGGRLLLPVFIELLSKIH